MKGLRKLRRYALIFLVVYLFLALSLFAVALIPRGLVKGQFIESADYLLENNTSFRLVDFRRSSTVDRFADCILLNIAYHIDEGNPVEAVMWARYYGGYSNYANQYLRESIVEDKPADNQYLRYWHGSVAPVRFLHLFWSIRSIYIFNAVLMAALLILLLFQLWLNDFRAEAVCLLAALAIVDIWVVPFCLEFTWMFLVMLAAADIAVFKVLRGKREFGGFFLVVGMVAAFLDFLTTETLTLLIPLLLIIRIRSRRESEAARSLWMSAAQCSLMWFVGFAGMWAMKWVTASAVLGENVMPYVLKHIGERLDGGNADLTTFAYIWEAVLRNIRSLPFYEYGMGGAVALFALIFLVVLLPVALNKARLRRSICWPRVTLYLCLGLVPYVRYMILHNHSYYHSFTYRAQAASILALCFIVFELVEIKRYTEPTSVTGR